MTTDLRVPPLDGMDYVYKSGELVGITIAAHDRLHSIATAAVALVGERDKEIERLKQEIAIIEEDLKRVQQDNSQFGAGA